MNTYLIIITIIILILFTLFIFRFLINNLFSLHKFIFLKKNFIVNLIQLKKHQHYFYKLEKYNNELLISGEKYFKINNYLFKLNKVKKISNKLTKNLILILFNNKSKFFKFKLDNIFYNKPISNNSINFLKIKTDKKKINILKDTNTKILNSFSINKNKKKLVLLLFVDGLSNHLSKNLKYSLKFFGKTNHLNNVFTNSAWTLPSLGNLITGQYTSTHLNYSPRSFYINKKKFSGTTKINSKITMFEYFKKKGFITGSYSPYVRINPTYAFDRGVDIFRFCENSTTDEIIDNLISQIEFFKDTSNFIFAHFFDAHHRIKTYDSVADYLHQPEKNYNYMELNKEQKIEKKNNNLKLKTFLKQKNFSDEIEVINRMRLIDFRLQRLYDYISKKKLDDFTILLMGDHGTRLNNLNNTGNVLDKFHQNIGFFIKDKRVKKFKTKKNNYLETVDLFPSLVSRYGDFKNKTFNKEFDGYNTLFSSQNKKNIFSESIYNDKYNLLVNYNENYLYSSYKIKDNKISFNIEKKYYDRNQNEVKNFKNFPYKHLETLENKHLKNSKLKIKIKK